MDIQELDELQVLLHRPVDTLESLGSPISDAMLSFLTFFLLVVLVRVLTLFKVLFLFWGLPAFCDISWVLVGVVDPPIDPLVPTVAHLLVSSPH